MSLSIRGVFFDLGGTLFHYEGANAKIGRKLVTNLASLPGAQRYATAELGQAFGHANREITKRYATLDYYLHAELFLDTYKRAVESLKLPFLEAHYEEFSEFQHQTIVDGLSLKEDCQATLTSLRERGLYLSIASNIDEDMLQPLVAREGLHQVLDDWTSSEEAQSCKPHHKFFEHCLEKSNLSPDQVLFVGDSPEHDINGSLALGMRAVLLKNGDLEAPLQSGAAVQDPDHTIHSLAEILEIV